MYYVKKYGDCWAIHNDDNGKSHYREGKDYQCDLSLNNDSSFVLTQKYFEANSACRGKWRYSSHDTILLTCDEEELSSKLQGGYMSERKKKLIILNRNKVKIGEVILRRKKEQSNKGPGPKSRRKS
jgi:hypothetical protein